MCCAFVGSDQAFVSFVSIEWLQKTFKNCVTLSSCRRTELRSQEVNKCSYLNKWVCLLMCCVFPCIWIRTFTIGLRYHCDYDMIIAMVVSIQHSDDGLTKIKIFFICNEVGIFSFCKIMCLAMHLVQQKDGFTQKEWK